MPHALLAVALIVGIGCALIALGLRAYARKRRFVETGYRATGVVTALVPRMSLQDSQPAQTVYAPSVTFAMHTGQQQSFTSRTASSRPSYRLGQEVVVVYDPLDPTKAIILSFGELWLVPLILWGLGALFVLVGLLVALGG